MGAWVLIILVGYAGELKFDSTNDPVFRGGSMRFTPVYFANEAACVKVAGEFAHEPSADGLTPLVGGHCYSTQTGVESSATASRREGVAKH
jgi:hypothetical protein